MMRFASLRTVLLVAAVALLAAAVMVEAHPQALSREERAINLEIFNPFTLISIVINFVRSLLYSIFSTIFGGGGADPETSTDAQ